MMHFMKRTNDRNAQIGGLSWLRRVPVISQKLFSGFFAFS